MRVLLTHRPGGAFGYILDSYLNCLRDKGHRVQHWDGLESSWNDFQPALYIGASGHKQPIPHKRNCKIAIHVNPYGPVQIEGINEAPRTIDWVVDQRPDCVFGYGQEEDRLLWSYWTTKRNIQWVPLPTAGDRLVFKQTLPEESKTYDIVYLGGRWSYKGLTIDKYLVPVLQHSKLSYKLHGWGDWPPGLCSGVLAEDQACQFLNSGRLAPCVSEGHTHSHGIDIPERAFKVALCGALIVHDPVLSLRRMIPSAIVAADPNQFSERLLYFAKPENATERIEISQRQRQEVLAQHTYHHRLARLFTALGLTEAATQMLE